MEARLLLPVAVCVLFLMNEAYGQQWSRLVPSTSIAPLPRRDATAIYDAVNHTMIVFGGRTWGGPVNEVWSFNLDSLRWTNLSPPPDSASPLPRFAHTAVFDPPTHKMFIWSGQGVAFFNDAWAFDLTLHRWEKLFPVSGIIPEARYGSVAVYDPRNRRLVMFAGFTNSGRYNDSQAYDIQTNGWIDLTPSGTKPAARCLHTAAYDAARHRMIMYGGQISGPIDDIWAFDLHDNTWTNLTPATRPPGRYFASSIYTDDRVFVFGGTTPTALVNELWSFDLRDSTWLQVIVSGTIPPARTSHSAIYVPKDRSMIVFGGIGDSMYNDVWKLGGFVTSVQDGEDRLPARIELCQNYPNPFNPTTELRFAIRDFGFVRLAVYDLLGREVVAIVDRELGQGAYAYTWDARGMPSGAYFLRLQSNGSSISRKMLLQR